MVAAIVFGKSLAAFLLVLAFRYPLHTALTVSASLTQIGEFSFILAGLGVALGVLPAEGQSLTLAGALISIALNPFIFRMVKPAQAWIRSRSRRARELEHRDDPLAELPADVAATARTRGRAAASRPGARRTGGGTGTGEQHGAPCKRTRRCARDGADLSVQFLNCRPRELETHGQFAHERGRGACWLHRRASSPKHWVFRTSRRCIRCGSQRKTRSQAVRRSAV